MIIKINIVNHTIVQQIAFSGDSRDSLEWNDAMCVAKEGVDRSSSHFLIACELWTAITNGGHYKLSMRKFVIINHANARQQQDHVDARVFATFAHQTRVAKWICQHLVTTHLTPFNYCQPTHTEEIYANTQFVCHCHLTINSCAPLSTICLHWFHFKLHNYQICLC